MKVKGQKVGAQKMKRVQMVNNTSKEKPLTLFDIYAMGGIVVALKNFPFVDFQTLHHNPAIQKGRNSISSKRVRSRMVGR